MKLLLTILFTTLLSSPCLADPTEKDQCESNGINYSAAKDFVKQFKTALSTNDKDKIADMMSYPVRVNDIINNKIHSYSLKDKKAFVKHYNELFPEQTRIGIQKDDALFCNYQGAMLYNGKVWFNTENGAKIVVINK